MEGGFDVNHWSANNSSSDLMSIIMRFLTVSDKNDIKSQERGEYASHPVVAPHVPSASHHFPSGHVNRDTRQHTVNKKRTAIQNISEGEPIMIVWEIGITVEYEKRVQ